MSRWFHGRSRQQRQANINGKRHRARLNLELLEDRMAPAVYNVNSLADTLAPAAGVITLRSAIQAVDTTTTPGPNTINLTLAGDYQITLEGTPNEHDNQAGEFVINPSASGSLTIVNTSNGLVTVDAEHLGRVFDINPGNNTLAPSFPVTFQGFTIQNGLASTLGNVANGNGTGNGAGIQVQGNILLTLNDMTLTNNTAVADGGGIFQSGSTLVVNNNTITGNHAAMNGGGIANTGSGSIAITQSIISNNFSGVSGGGIYQGSASPPTASLAMTIVQCSIEGNTSGSSGGGVFINAQTLTMEDSTVANNTAIGSSSGGGGIELQTTGTGSSITNSTIAGNSAPTNGGGIDAPATYSGSLTLQSDTINSNFATAAGGGLYWAGTTGSSITILNTILAQNVAATGPDINNVNGSTIMDQGGNLLSTNEGSNILSSGSILIGANPELGELANNGGPSIGAPSSAVTLPTESLQPGSLAIDAGVPSTLTTDERGFTRPDKTTPTIRPDIGAYETQALTGTAAFVAALYRDFLHRNADLNNPLGAGSWLAQLNSNALTDQQVATMIAHSPEALTIVVNGLYAKLLNRQADPVGQTAFVNFLVNGGTEEQVIVTIVSSPEFNALTGGTATGFVQALYNKLLGRNGTTAEVAAWVAQLQTYSEVAVAGAFATSTEYLTDEVEEMYGFTPAPAGSVASLLPNLLHRSQAPTGAEIGGWVNSLTASANILAVEEMIAGSTEYFNLATTLTGGMFA